MSRYPRPEDEIQEAKTMGQALATLRRSRGLTQRELAQKAGLACPQISRIERGFRYPRQAHLKRLLQAMGVSFAALHRAQELVEDPMGEQDTAMDAPDFTPEETHQAAVKLAQEAGKAVAHCCLAFMELTSGGWRRSATRSRPRHAGATSHPDP